MTLEGRVVVVSPHLDDAVFSLGAAIARASRSGAHMSVVTVFAGVPTSTVRAGWWDEQAGFTSEGEAARARREEDRVACKVVGATPVWLPFSDATYERRVEEDELWAAVESAIEGAETVLIPGYPLEHVDHLIVSRLILGRGAGTARLGLYVEQPYAKRRAKRRAWIRPVAPDQLETVRGRELPWTYLAAEPRDTRAKRRAALSYRSQIPLFGRWHVEALGRLLITRVALYERLRGGEAVAWLDAA
jgi:LmbE family N-acetylglucosaminyl deacetylase